MVGVPKTHTHAHTHTHTHTHTHKHRGKLTCSSLVVDLTVCCPPTRRQTRKLKGRKHTKQTNKQTKRRKVQGFGPKSNQPNKERGGWKQKRGPERRVSKATTTQKEWKEDEE